MIYIGDSIFFTYPSFDDAIVGATEDGNIVYDFEKMVESLARHDAISTEMATDFIEYNTIRAIPYMPDPKPIIIYPIDLCEGGDYE